MKFIKILSKIFRKICAKLMEISNSLARILHNSGIFIKFLIKFEKKSPKHFWKFKAKNFK